MHKILLLILFVVLIVGLSFSAEYSVYGEDDRVYLKDVPDDPFYYGDEYRRLKNSICLIVHKDNINELWETGDPVPYPKGGFEVYRANYTLEDQVVDDMGGGTVSDDLKFKDDLIVTVNQGGVATGVIVGDRKILTADHIFVDANGGKTDPSNFVALCGFIDDEDYIWADGKIWLHSVAIDPYYAFRIIGYDYHEGKTSQQFDIPNSAAKMDLSIIKTDRIIAREVVAVDIMYQTKDQLKSLIEGKELFMIGHPYGLPLVFTDNAFCNFDITFEQAGDLFKNLTEEGNNPLNLQQFERSLFVNLDGFEGNSGSPVFCKDNAWNWKVVGIYHGGPKNEYIVNNNGEIVENVYTEQQFVTGEKCELVQTLDVVKFEPRSPKEEQDYIEIPYEGLSNTKQPRGIPITVHMPSGLANGLYFCYFTDNSYAKVLYWQGSSTVNTVTYRVPTGLAYNVYLLNVESRTVAYNFHVSGIALGEEQKLLNKKIQDHKYYFLAQSGQYEVNELSFEPDIRVGGLPHVVFFRPVFPDDAYYSLKNYESTYSWDFGDGNTSDFVRPFHIYTVPGTYDVTFTVTYYTGMSDSYTFEDCITVNAEMELLSNFQTIDLDQPLYLSNTKSVPQANPSTCIAKDIIIYPETVIREGAEVKLIAK